MNIDKACWERGCACFDDRVDKESVAVIKKEWVSLTDEEKDDIDWQGSSAARVIELTEEKLKEKNT